MFIRIVLPSWQYSADGKLVNNSAVVEYEYEADPTPIIYGDPVLKLAIDPVIPKVSHEETEAWNAELGADRIIYDDTDVFSFWVEDGMYVTFLENA